MARVRFVALGDSFTEGVGDELSDGYVRGWADLMAEGIARSLGEPIEYANFAVRGKLLAPIIAEQLEPAIKLGPTLVSFAGGGNDMLRPSVDVGNLVRQTERALHAFLDIGAEPFMLSSGNFSQWVPMSERIQQRGDTFVDAALQLSEKLDVPYVNNWIDPELAKIQYWSEDRLHLGPAGHRRVAANALRELGFTVPAEWKLTVEEAEPPGRLENAKFAVQYVAPWITRRLTGRSSGDGREPKYTEWVTITPNEPLL